MTGRTAAPVPLRVLIVEDSEDDVQLELLELRRAGFDPTHLRVDQRGQFLEALDGGPWQVVLCDHGLPAFSARETIRILADRGLDVPVIMVSGQMGEDAAIEALHGGAADYVLKGNLRRLGASVKGVLRAAAERVLRRHAEEGLRREEGLRNSLVENAVFGIFRVSLVGRVLMANPALALMLGRPSAAELVGALLPAEAFADPPTWDRLAADCVRTGRILRVEMPWKRRDGKVLRVRLSGTLASESGSGPQAIDGIVEDVTELRALEEQFLHAQKMEAVGRLAGGVAHDFNNMLTVIHGYSELLEETVAAGSQGKEWIGEIRRATGRASALTRQLLAFSRRNEVHPRVADVNVLLLDLSKMLRRLIGERITLEIRPCRGEACVRIDTGQFEQVIANLVVNARDAMPDGGTLMIETEVAEERVGIHVHDTGTGMDAETRGRIFEPFFTTKKEGEGTGLGLATVFAIVERAEGRVEVESEPGKGATFRILLPRVEASCPAASPAVLPGVRGGSESVLLVEDEASLRDLLEGGLLASGYSVVVAGSGAEALEKARAHAGPLHALVSDMVMPGISWRDLVARLAAERPGLRVLLISGYGGEEGSNSRPGPGDPPVFVKPFTVDAFLRRVREVLDAP